MYITYRTNSEKSVIYSENTSNKTQNYKNKIEFLLSEPKENDKFQLKYVPKFLTIEAENSLEKFIEKKTNQLINTDFYETILNKIKEFYRNNPDFKRNKKEFYREIKIPKAKGGIRILHEPTEELKEIQSNILHLITHIYKVNPHEAAHAYEQKRDGITNAKMHKNSNHFVKLDCKDFFPSISKSFIKSTLKYIFDFSIINYTDEEIKNAIIKKAPSHYSEREIKVVVKKLLIFKQLIDEIPEIATYNNGLPQGSPLSPKLTNIIMIPTDFALYELSKNKEKITKTRLMYTRYADDLTFSSLHPINLKLLLEAVNKHLPPYVRLNHTKTKYLKITNRVFITGVKISRNHKTTYGHMKTAQLKRDIFQICIDTFENECHDIQTNQEVLGRASYAMQIEPEKVKGIIRKYSRKFHKDPTKIYKLLTK